MHPTPATASKPLNASTATNLQQKAATPATANNHAHPTKKTASASAPSAVNAQAASKSQQSSGPRQSQSSSLRDAVRVPQAPQKAPPFLEVPPYPGCSGAQGMRSRDDLNQGMCAYVRMCMLIPVRVYKTSSSMALT